MASDDVAIHPMEGFRLSHALFPKHQMGVYVELCTHRGDISTAVPSRSNLWNKVPLSYKLRMVCGQDGSLVHIWSWLWPIPRKVVDKAKPR